MEKDDIKNQQVIDRLISDPQKYEKVRKIVLEEIEDMKRTIEYLDKIFDSRNEPLKKAN